MKLSKKWKIGIGGFLALFIISSFLPDSKVEESKQELTKEVSVEEKKEPTLSRDELIKELEFYETLFNNHIQGLDKIEQGNDILEMQNSFSLSKAASDSAFGKLFELAKDYDSSSNEYKAINELQTAFSSLENACDNGIKYLDKNEYKYYEKYEENLKQCGIFIERYNEAKNNI